MNALYLAPLLNILKVLALKKKKKRKQQQYCRYIAIFGRNKGGNSSFLNRFLETAVSQLFSLKITYCLYKIYLRKYLKKSKQIFSIHFRSIFENTLYLLIVKMQEVVLHSVSGLSFILIQLLGHKWVIKLLVLQHIIQLVFSSFGLLYSSPAIGK